MPWPTRWSDAAVSESIGYVIISGILCSLLAIIFLMGYPLYNNYVDQSHLQNMMEGFDLVSENGNNVALLKTPYQQSEIKLYGGNVGIRGVGTMRVQYFADLAGTTPVAPTGGSSTTGDSVALRALEYSKDDSTIAYLLGGVFKRDEHTYPVIKKPDIYSYTRADGTPVLYLPLISLYENTYSLAGTTLARISFGTLYYSKKNQTVSQPVFNIYDHVRLVKITLESDYNDCLYTYFHDEWGFDKDMGESTADKLVMTKAYSNPATGITVNTVQSFVIASINTGTD